MLDSDNFGTVKFPLQDKSKTIHYKKKKNIYADVEMSKVLRGWFYHAAQTAIGDRHQIHFPHTESWQDWLILFCIA